MDYSTKNKQVRIKDGFRGQKLIVLPHDIINSLKNNILTTQLYLTHIGFFPLANNHFVERSLGSEDYILIYCIGGEGWYRTSGLTEKIYPGEFFVIPAKSYHQYGTHKKNPWSIYFLHFNGRLAEILYQKIAAEPKILLTTDADRKKLFEHIYKVLDTGYSTNNLEHANMMLWQVLNTFIFKDYFPDKSGNASLNHSTENFSIKEAITYMRRNLDKKILLKELANIAGLSISRFSSVFKEATGFAPNDYFIRLKIQKACQYLDLTDKRIKEISHLVGIDDPYYFSRLFKKIIGKSPIQYRLEKK